MMKILPQYDDLYKDWIYKHQGKNERGEIVDVRWYRQIVGGICFPGNLPGFAVVMGRELAKMPPYRVYLLAESEHANAGDLLDNASELKKRFNVSAFYGYVPEESQEAYFLSKWNHERSLRRLSPLYISNVPFTEGGKITYHLNVLFERLKSSEKTLFLGDTSKVPGYLDEIGLPDVSTARASEFPAIAALSFAVSQLAVWDEDIPESLKRDDDEGEYDPFDYM